MHRLMMGLFGNSERNEVKEYSATPPDDYPHRHGRHRNEPSHPRVNYGLDIGGNSVTSVSWEDPETGTVADSIIRAGIISHLQELEVDSTFEGWDE